MGRTEDAPGDEFAPRDGPPKNKETADNDDSNNEPSSATFNELSSAAFVILDTYDNAQRASLSSNHSFCPLVYSR